MRADLRRRLAIVDPMGRELLLSLGAFLANLELAAGALGLAVDARSTGDSVETLEVALGLGPAKPTGFDPSQIALRRTLRKNYLPGPLDAAECRALVAAGGPVLWIPRDDRRATWLRETVVEAFRQQTWRDDAQAELATWMRFTGKAAARSADGLTLPALELGPVARAFVGGFMGPQSVSSRSFRQRGIDAVARQAGEGAGFLVLGSEDTSLAALVEAGRRYGRTALGMRERHLALHPMSQVLEEQPWRDTVAQTLGLSSPVQFVLRVGRVARYPDPVSPRRPVSSFASRPGEP